MCFGDRFFALLGNFVVSSRAAALVGRLSRQTDSGRSGGRLDCFGTSDTLRSSTAPGKTFGRPERYNNAIDAAWSCLKVENTPRNTDTANAGQHCQQFPPFLPPSVPFSHSTELVDAQRCSETTTTTIPSHCKLSSSSLPPSRQQTPRRSTDKAPQLAAGTDIPGRVRRGSSEAGVSRRGNCKQDTCSFGSHQGRSSRGKAQSLL